ncbi:zf-HC2 domain-containing protein [Paracidobacterium acidisoli]|uniref:Zf-HC2 domain-containing protein n=1 Tax=Paracidobacterium acidisoli TaxID=2303751 RepID=A0A372ISQ3_9BACT|nr:zf-HC2 domain-containing protein [Paracidobacterium acidisoli]MBT9330732.1 zf-HC2 domain-containing protein [Paracidobacterium acidisoli]
MDHKDAIGISAVEKYLLHELTPEQRDAFEEHYFGCEECFSDLRSAQLFLDAAKLELARQPEVMAPAVSKDKKLIRFPLFMRPAVLIPAMAAMLAIIVFQNAVTVPSLRGDVASLDRPQLLSSVALADGSSRGGPTPEVVTQPHQRFVLSVDIPAQDRFSRYTCSLYSPSGSRIWTMTIPASRTTDAVPISISPDTTKAGVNTLIIQGIPKSGGDATPVDLSRDSFLLTIRS